MWRMDELLRLARRLHLAPGGRVRPLAWQPPVDVYRTAAGWLVKVELAGVEREAVEVRTSGHCLVVRGCRYDTEVADALASHSLEISYSRFARVVELPQTLDGARIATDYRQGMLLVHVTPKGTGP